MRFLTQLAALLVFALPAHAQALSDLIVEHCQGWIHLEHGRLPSAARGASA